MKKIVLILFAVITSVSLAGQVLAQDRVAVSVEASTLGPGAKGTIKVSDNFNVRLGGNGFSYNFSGKAQDVDYKVKLNLISFGALADWFPFDEKGFKATAGVLVNKNRVNINAKPAVTYKVGDTVYTAAQAGSINGKITFPAVAPYLGVGWGNPFGEESSWSWGIDLGAMYQGSPKVDLSADGILADDPTFQSNLSKEKDEVQDRVDKYKFYPVVAVAVTYKF